MEDGVTRVKTPLMRTAILAMFSMILGILTTIAPPITTEEAEAAPSWTAFDAGLIISDSVFYDFGAMTAAQIDSFIASKNSCSASQNPPCLSRFKGDTTVTTAYPGEGCDKPLKAATNRTAGQIIKAVADACKINPQVLLIMLQREQSLITDNTPSEGQYRKAMGWGCPDTAPCNPNGGGFARQLWLGAQQFNFYKNNTPSWKNKYNVGKTWKLKHHPSDTTCGTKSVKIMSEGTRALYIYTPYTPTDATLKAGYGSVSKCGAYGNRNFWLLFHDWFGSPIGGSYLMQEKGKTDTYLIANDVRYKFTNSSLLNTYKGVFGKVGTVSKAYIESFPVAGNVTNVIKDGSDYYIIDGNSKLRYKLAGGCAQVTDFGITCGDVLTLTSTQLLLIPKASENYTGYLNAGSDGKFLVVDGVRHEVITESGLEDARAIDSSLPESFPALTSQSVSMINHLPLGNPIVENATYFTTKTSKLNYFYDEGIFQQLQAGNTAFNSWLGPAQKISDATVSAVGILTWPEIFSVSTDEDNYYTVYGKSLIQLATGSNWRATATKISDSLAAKLPAPSKSITGPAFVKGKSSSTVYLVVNATKRKLQTTSHIARLKREYVASSATVHTLSDGAVKLIKTGNLVIPSGLIIQEKNAKGTWVRYLVSGENKIKVPTAERIQIYGSKTKNVVTVPKGTVATLKTLSGTFDLSFTCADTKYIISKTKAYKVSDFNAAQYTGALKFYTLSTEACVQLTKTKSTIGSVFSYSGKYYQVVNGKKYKISKAAADKLAKDLKPIRAVSLTFLNKIPNAKSGAKPPKVTVPKVTLEEPDKEFVLTDSAFVRVANTSTVYLLTEDSKRALIDNSLISRVAHEFAVSDETVHVVESEYLETFTDGGKIIPSGLIIQERVGTGWKRFLISGSDKLEIPTAERIEVYGTSTKNVITVPSGTMDTFNTVGGFFDLSFTCDGESYIISKTKAMKLSELNRNQFSNLLFAELNAEACFRLTNNSSEVGSVINFEGKYYQVVDGLKYQVSLSYVQSLPSELMPSRAVAKTFFDKIPSAPAGATVPIVDI